MRMADSGHRAHTPHTVPSIVDAAPHRCILTTFSCWLSTGNGTNSAAYSSILWISLLCGVTKSICFVCSYRGKLNTRVRHCRSLTDSIFPFDTIPGGCKWSTEQQYTYGSRSNIPFLSECDSIILILLIKLFVFRTTNYMYVWHCALCRCFVRRISNTVWAEWTKKNATHTYPSIVRLNVVYFPFYLFTSTDIRTSSHWHYDWISIDGYCQQNDDQYENKAKSLFTSFRRYRSVFHHRQQNDNSSE